MRVKKCFASSRMPRSRPRHQPRKASCGPRICRRLPRNTTPWGWSTRRADHGAIRTDHLAFRDLHDYLDKRGLVEGKKLLDDFAQSPYGWFKDTTRYIIAAMLAAGLIKLRVSGIEIPTPTPQAIEALKGQQSFHKIGIMLRGAPPDTALLLRTSERLLELTGKSVIPLERDIATAVLEFFPDFQNAYASARSEARGARIGGIGPGRRAFHPNIGADPRRGIRCAAPARAGGQRAFPRPAVGSGCRKGFEGRIREACREGATDHGRHRRAPG